MFISWQLRLQGFEVELFESGDVLQQTSSAPSKLLYGVIRYLESGAFGASQRVVDRPLLAAEKYRRFLASGQELYARVSRWSSFFDQVERWCSFI